MHNENYYIACDTGGTFTDLVCLTSNGAIHSLKTLTTYPDPSEGFMIALNKMAKKLGLTVQELLSRTLVLGHGTTLATNTILTMTGAKVAFLATDGFEDLLIQRMQYKEWGRFDLTDPPPEQWVLVPRNLCFGIRERITHKGNVFIPLDVDQSKKVFEKLGKEKVEAIAVCFLNSFLTPIHEKAIKQLIEENLPQIKHVSLSHEINPQIGEYYRASTTVLDAYIKPVMTDYLLKLSGKLKSEGFRYDAFIATCSGGIVTSGVASSKVVLTINSGPSLAPSFAICLGKLANWNNVISVDMGGTSFDVVVCKDLMVPLRYLSQIEKFHFNVPSVDAHTIGAGGGSIAWIDEKGILRVGPRSAASNPGPACYGFGGTEPTVTDADLVLGYINPEYFTGGEMKLNVDLAIKAIKEKVCEKTGLEVVEAASGIYDVVNSNMVDAIRVVTIQRGEEPKYYKLTAGGGASGVHVIRLAQELMIDEVMIPRLAPFYSAFGLFVSELRYETLKSMVVETDKVSMNVINAIFDELEGEGRRVLIENGIEESMIYHRRFLDMRYVEQIHQITTPIPLGALKSLEKAKEAFHELHEKLYGYKELDSPIEIVTFRVLTCSKLPEVSLPKQERRPQDPSHALKGKREVFWRENDGYEVTEIYDGEKLLHGNMVTGAAIIELPTTSIVLPPKAILNVDPYGNYVIKAR
ncbi:MAG: hydantoinase/oxoprolinase family protein [Candidatus Bathyarchaeia archaeon]